MISKLLVNKINLSDLLFIKSAEENTKFINSAVFFNKKF